MFADGAVRPSALTIWTTGFGVPELAANSGLRTDTLGRLLTDETLTSVDDERIVAAGDAAAPSGQALRMSCQAAGPLGVQAGNTVLSRIAGTKPAVIDQAFLGSSLSLGRRAATLQWARKDDSSLNFYIGGRIGAAIKEAACKARPVGDPARSPQARLAFLGQGRQASRAAGVRGGHEPVTTEGPIAGSAGGEHAERFTVLRPLLFTIVYEILGSATESDDVLQDSYLRWADVDLATVRDTKAYLAQLVTRQALNALRASARRREDYVGPWLPEPLLLDDRDASADVVLAESVSMAMLVLLETLSPDERAVFVLREVFGFDYDEIAGAVGKSVAAVHQTAHRAREHVHARRKRFEPVDPTQTARITEQFLTAAATGDTAALLSLLAPDATWTTDSGGKAIAIRTPIVGAEKVAAAILRFFRLGQRLADMRFETAVYNSAPAVVIYSGDRLEGVFLMEITDGKITNFYAIRNPDKLAAIAVPRTISR